MSAARLPKFHPSDLDEEQQALYDSIASGPRAQGPQLFRLTDDEGRLEGPFNAFLLQPGVGAALQDVGAAVRYRTGLDGRSREIAILRVAGEWDSAFEWYAHEAVARSLGVTDEQLDAIRTDRFDEFDEDEARVLRVVSALAKNNDLDDALYDDAVAAFGLDGLFELLTLVGYYSTLALQMRVFRVIAPVDDEHDNDTKEAV
jgi:4-carboxymuconolactone decarboxylase